MTDDEKKDEEAAAEPEGAAADAETAEKQQENISEEELRARLEEHFRQQSVADVLVQFLISLSTLAYVKMGLTEDTRQYQDLEQSSLAIDSFKALLQAAGSRLPEQDAKALEGALASMQMTFVKAEQGGDTLGGEMP